MNSKVIKLADLSKMEVSPAYREAVVTDEKVNEVINSMVATMSEEVSVESTCEGCCVVCANKDGKKVLVYPGLGIPGAEAAEKDAEGKVAGDEFTTKINGEEISLKVVDILVGKMPELNDDFAAKCEIEGVATLEELKAHVKVQETEKLMESNCKQLLFDYDQYLVENSEKEIDDVEAAEWAQPMAKMQYEEELSFGIDLKITEDGTMITEEEAIALLAEDLKKQFAAMVVYKKFAEEKGFVPEEGMDPDMACNGFVMDTLYMMAKEALND